MHVSVDRTGKYLLSAYYYQARVGVHGFGDDGRLDPTPIEWRETGIGAHYIQTDASNRYAFVPHIAEGSQTGPNAIFQFRFDESTGRLTPNDPDRANPTSPEGPRHICFNPNRDVVYSSNEQGCSVTAYRFDADAGTLSPFQTVPTLPEGFTERNTCSQIQITPSGRFLYAPNRGHNSVAGFAVNRRGRQPDRHRAGGHGGGAPGLQPGHHGQLPVRLGPGDGTAGVLSGQPGQRGTGAAGGIRHRAGADVGDDHRPVITRRMAG